MLLYDISRLIRMHNAPAAARLLHTLRIAPVTVPQTADFPIKKG